MDEFRLLNNFGDGCIPQVQRPPYYNGRIIGSDRAFRLFLVYHHTSDTILDIPLCMYRAVYGKIVMDRVLPGACIMVPLFRRGNFCNVYRGGESLFNNVLSTWSYHWDLRKVKDSSGNEYYGGFGCIFDENFHPIIVTCRRLLLESNGPEIIRNSKVLKISQNIYQHSDRLLEKFILNKMLPTVLRNNTFDCVEFSSLAGYTMRPCEGIEESINDNALNECLQANLDALLEDV